MELFLPYLIDWFTFFARTLEMTAVVHCPQPDDCRVYLARY
jgi:hypothetical protein